MLWLWLAFNRVIRVKIRGARNAIKVDACVAVRHARTRSHASTRTPAQPGARNGNGVRGRLISLQPWKKAVNIQVGGGPAATTLRFAKPNQPDSGTACSRKYSLFCVNNIVNTKFKVCTYTKKFDNKKIFSRHVPRFWGVGGGWKNAINK